MAMLEVEHINKSFGRTEVLKDVNFSLEEGQVSKPFLMVDRSGKTVYCIAKLKSKTKAHKANMSHDFALLKQLYEGHKKQEKLNSWIAKKQKETYVRIDENWKNCDFEHDGWIK